MKKRLLSAILVLLITGSIAACGQTNVATNDNTDSQVETPEKEVVENEPEEEVIDENILYVSNETSAFNSDNIREMANNRYLGKYELFPGSKVPIPDSCVNGLIEYGSSDGNYGYFFGSGEDAKDKEVYLSGVCAYAAVLHSLGLRYELDLDGGFSKIYDGDEQVAVFMVFNTDKEGYYLIMTP